MDEISRYRIQSYAVLTLVGVGYGFYSGWNSTAVTLSVIFPCLLVSEAFASYFAGLGLTARKQIRRMTPSELERHIESLSRQRRQAFVSQLLAVGHSDDEYIAGLTAEQRTQFETLLEKLKAEQGPRT